MKKEFIQTVIVSIVLGFIISACYLNKSNKCVELERIVAKQKSIINTYLPIYAKTEEETPAFIGACGGEQ